MKLSRRISPLSSQHFCYSLSPNWNWILVFKLKKKKQTYFFASNNMLAVCCYAWVRAKFEMCKEIKGYENVTKCHNHNKLQWGAKRIHIFHVIFEIKGKTHNSSSQWHSYFFCAMPFPYAYAVIHRIYSAIACNVVDTFIQKHCDSPQAASMTGLTTETTTVLVPMSIGYITRMVECFRHGTYQIQHPWILSTYITNPIHGIPHDESMCMHTLLAAYWWLCSLSSNTLFKRNEPKWEQGMFDGVDFSSYVAFPFHLLSWNATFLFNNKWEQLRYIESTV